MSIDENAVVEGASALANAGTPRRCSRIFRAALSAFNLDAFACGEVDLLEPTRCVFFAINWPDRWREYYFSSKIVRRDPIVDALRRHQKPFTWSDLAKDRKVAPIGSEALKLTAEFGWTEGLAVPIWHGKLRCGLVSMAGPRGPFSAAERSRLAILALSFYTRLRSLVPEHGFAVPPARLSKREIDCLRLIARGATDRTVAAELKISADTAHGYIEQAKKKLKVSNRAEAIAIAVALAILSP